MVNKTSVKISLLFLLLGTSLSLKAQENLQLKELINESLEVNYQIQIVKNNQREAQNSNTVGNAGMLPDVDISGEQRVSLSNSKQQYLTGDSQAASNAKSSATSASIDANWIVFDGLAMFGRKDQLEQLELLSNEQTRYYIEQTAFDIATAYYQLRQEDQLLASYRKSLDVSQTRYDYELRSFDVGSSTGLDVQQALVDRNTDSSLVLTQKALIQELNIQINRTINRDLTQTIIPTDSIILTESFDLVGIMANVNDNNTQLNEQQIRELIAQSDVKIAKGALFPEVELFGSYNFNKQSNEVGFLSSSRTYGPDFGIRVRFNLFSGSQERIRSQNLQIASESESLRTEDLSQELEASTRVAYLRWKSRLEQVALETQSVVAAEKALQIAAKQYEVGTITNVDFRVIQLNAIGAKTRFLESQYAAKSRELELYRLSGTLLNKLLQ